MEGLPSEDVAAGAGEDSGVAALHDSEPKPAGHCTQQLQQ